MSQYRVFLSYSRENRALVECLDEVLRKAGVDPIWDREFREGVPLNDQIKAFIEHAHVFAPILSKAANLSVWVHAEMGYAIAPRVPVLPICLKCEPSGLIKDLLGVVLQADPENRAAFLAEANARLTLAQIEHLAGQSSDQP